MSPSRKSQTGMSFLGTLLILIVAGFLFSLAFKLYQPYYDNYVIDSVLTKVIDDDEELSKTLTTLRRDLDKKFRINQIRLGKDDLIIRQEKGVIKFTLDYEVRVPMYYNVDAVVVFNQQYEAIKP